MHQFLVESRESGIRDVVYVNSRLTRLLLCGAFGEQVSVSNIVDLDVFGEVSIVRIFRTTHARNRRPRRSCELRGDLGCNGGLRPFTKSTKISHSKNTKSVKKTTAAAAAVALFEFSSVFGALTDESPSSPGWSHFRFLSIAVRVCLCTSKPIARPLKCLSNKRQLFSFPQRTQKRKSRRRRPLMWLPIIPRRRVKARTKSLWVLQWSSRLSSDAKPPFDSQTRIFSSRMSLRCSQNVSM